ncbi:MAG: 3'(2'),5'-bisphosphate nucleotidase CysQ family protein [Acidobacteriaceae bacterium]
MTELDRLLQHAQSAALDAGAAIRKCPAPSPTPAGPGSIAQTLADLRAHEALAGTLSSISPRLPIASEEGDRHVTSDRYWLVDPLDGTKEYLAGNGEYTVNVALIENGYPVLGVMYVPEADLLYWAAEGLGTWMRRGQTTTPLPTLAPAPATQPRVLMSRSHSSAAMGQALDRLRAAGAVIEGLGSSWKFARVAEGAADLYVRLSPTYAWDTAAGQCLIEQRGGRVGGVDNRLRYACSDALAPGFLAAGTPEIWHHWAGVLEVKTVLHPPGGSDDRAR